MLDNRLNINNLKFFVKEFIYNFKRINDIFNKNFICAILFILGLIALLKNIN